MFEQDTIKHHIERSIIAYLMTHEHARFSEMRPSNIDTNLFTYHLKILVKQGYIEKTEKAILKEVEDMKNGNITDFEIEATKRAIVYGFRTSNDTTAGIDNWYSSQFINDGFNSIEELAAKYNAVTKEEIVEAAKKLTLDTVYVLKNK